MRDLPPVHPSEILTEDFYRSNALRWNAAVDAPASSLLKQSTIINKTPS